MPKTNLNASLVELAITRVHDYMVVTVKVTKIYGKMNFNRWALAVTAVPTTLTRHHDFKQLVTHECCNKNSYL